MIPVETQNLSKTYSSGILRKPRIQALDNVSLTIHTRRNFLTARTERSRENHLCENSACHYHLRIRAAAKIFGEDCKKHGIKKRIGFLPENHRYPAHLSAEGVLGYYGRLSGLDGATLRKRIDYLLDLMDMTKWRRVRISRYSKGMLQRIGIAQALINDPDLIFLDEPTDGVDPVGRKEIREILKNLRNEGKTIFLNSHLLSEVELVSDRITILKTGKVIRTGTVNELTESRNEFRISVENPGNISALPDTLKHIGTFRTEHNDIVFHPESIDDLNIVIDALRAEGILIGAITRTRVSLEDYFIDVIKEESQE
jgi:ABC-2 type transport system ATP-binding protein